MVAGGMEAVQPRCVDLGELLGMLLVILGEGLEGGEQGSYHG